MREPQKGGPKKSQKRAQNDKKEGLKPPRRPFKYDKPPPPNQGGNQGTNIGSLKYKKNPREATPPQKFRGEIISQKGLMCFR